MTRSMASLRPVLTIRAVKVAVDPAATVDGPTWDTLRSTLSPPLALRPPPQAVNVIATRSVAYASNLTGKIPPAKARGRERAASRPALSANPSLDERNLETLLVHDRSVAEIAIFAEQLAVVGGDDEPGVLGRLLDELADQAVDVLD